jgi:hypothetical protein
VRSIRLRFGFIPPHRLGGLPLLSSWVQQGLFC